MRPYICKHFSSKSVYSEKYLLSNKEIYFVLSFYGYGFLKIAEQQEGTYEQLALGFTNSDAWMVLVDE